MALVIRNSSSRSRRIGGFASLSQSHQKGKGFPENLGIALANLLQFTGQSLHIHEGRTAVARVGPHAAAAAVGVARFLCIALGLAPTLQLAKRGAKGAVGRVKRSWRSRHWRQQRASAVAESDETYAAAPSIDGFAADDAAVDLNADEAPPGLGLTTTMARSLSEGVLQNEQGDFHRGGGSGTMSGMPRTMSEGMMSIDAAAEAAAESAARRRVAVGRCAVCWHHDSEMVFWPCGHVCICTTCAPRLENPRRCVTCNKNGKLPVRVFFP